MQLHFLFALSWDKVGFVEISSARMADSKSFSSEEAPCMGVPPVIFTLAFACGFGEEVREGLRSDINGPAAEGGGFEDGRGTTGLVVVELDDAVGFWVASGLSLRAEVLDFACLAGLALLDM